MTYSLTYNEKTGLLEYAPCSYASRYKAERPPVCNCKQCHERYLTKVIAVHTPDYIPLGKDFLNAPAA